MRILLYEFEGEVGRIAKGLESLPYNCQEGLVELRRFHKFPESGEECALLEKWSSLVKQICDSRRQMSLALRPALTGEQNKQEQGLVALRTSTGMGGRMQIFCKFSMP